MDTIDRVEALLAGQGTAQVTEAHLGELCSSPIDLVEFAAVRWTRFRTQRDDLLGDFPAAPPGSIIDLARAWATGISVLDLAEDRYQAQRISSFKDLHVCEIPSEAKGWNPGSPFRRFEEAFRDTLVQCGHARAFANTLSGALSELASNADEHSDSTVPGFACFAVEQRTWAFAVCDVGIGARASLASNPVYARFAHDLAALQAALRPGVSKTGQPGRGYGFRSVFKALADRRTRLRIRSGAALALWEGESPTHQTLDWTSPLACRGFQAGIRGLERLG